MKLYRAKVLILQSMNQLSVFLTYSSLILLLFAFRNQRKCYKSKHTEYKKDCAYTLYSVKDIIPPYIYLDGRNIHDGAVCKCVKLILKVLSCFFYKYCIILNSVY